MSREEEAAREALRARQGTGARYDAETAPHDDLLLARRGTAYFARKLGELSDNQLDAMSLRDGWSRRLLIAKVGYRARMYAEAVAALRKGAGAADVAAFGSEHLALGATLPSRALRHLVHHAAIHLDVEWRDLPADRWEADLRLPGGEALAVRALPRFRAVEVWQAAIDLGNGGRKADIPVQLRG